MSDLTAEARAKLVVSIWLDTDLDDFTQSCIAYRGESLIRRIALEFEAVEQETDRRWQAALHPMMAARVVELFSSDRQAPPPKAGDAGEQE